MALLLYGLVLFSLWVCTLWLLKRTLISRLKKWAGGTDRHWDDLLIEAIHLPLKFLILGSGLILVAATVPVPKGMRQLSTLLFQFSIVLATFLFANKIVKGLIDANAHLPVFSKLSTGVVKGLVRFFVAGIAILIVLDLAGISITPILASLGIGSVAVALALQNTLSNFFSGIYMAIDQPIKKGDFIKLESGEEGYVIDIGWRSTSIRTLPHTVVVVPNAKLMESTITNYHQPDQEVAVLIEVGVHYNSDLALVEKVVEDVGKAVMTTSPGGVPNFAPFIRYHAFGDSSVKLTVTLRAREFSDTHPIRHEFIKALHERFKKEKIVIPFPIRTIEISQTAIESDKKIRNENRKSSREP